VRDFRDASGIDWRVYPIEPQAGIDKRDPRLPDNFRSGWLVFESATDKRRLAPVPTDWRTASDEVLASLCARASSQTARSGTPRDKAPGAQPSVRAITPENAEPLRPQLRTLEQRLDKTLEQVCETPAAEKLDTGQLIRVEETLAIAANAAKEAVSMRRRMKADLNERERLEQERRVSPE